MGSLSFAVYCETSEQAEVLDSCYREVTSALEEGIFLFEARDDQRVIHRATKKFLALLKDLPQSIQVLSQQKFMALQNNLRDQSLNFKPWVCKNSNSAPIWQVYVNYRYRALALKTENSQGTTVFQWFWIGTRNVLDHWSQHIGRSVMVPNIDREISGPQKPARIM